MDEHDLPEPAEQDWVLEHLVGLACDDDQNHPLARPILEPSPRFFPDLWTPDVAGVTGMTRCLLEYAGLGALEPEITTFYLAPDEPASDSAEPRAPVGGFAGIADSRCSFLLSLSQLTDPVSLVGVMAHEVAHAFRQHHQLCVADDGEEERLTDLTAVHLGFGILLANAAKRLHVVRENNRTVLIGSEKGYLSLETLCFALAAQLRARSMDEERTARLTRFLASDQQICLQASLNLLADTRPEAIHRLRDIVRAARPPEPGAAYRRPAGRGTLPLREAPVVKPGAPNSPHIDAYLGRPWGHVGYRLRKRPWVASCVLGVVGGAVLMRLLGGPAGAAALLAATYLGPLAAFFIARDTCAHCGARAVATDEECPCCGRMFLGEIRDPPPKLWTARNLGQVVFRVRRHHGVPYAIRATLLSAPAALCATALAGTAASIATMSGSAIAGFIIGRLRRRDFCSECGAVIDAALLECPACMGDIRGVIASEEERLEAEMLPRGERGKSG